MNKYKNSHSEATTEYNKRSTFGFTIRLNYKTDDDILTALESVNNRNALIKKLLRAAIAAESEPEFYGWVDNWVENPDEPDGGHWNGLICPRCAANGTARPFYMVYSFCPDCGLNMYSQRGKKPKLKKAGGGK